MDLPLHAFLYLAGLGWLAALDLLNAAGLALLALSFRAHPCVLTSKTLFIRMGALHSADVSVADIETFLPCTPAHTGRTLVVLTPPNVTLKLRRPVSVHSLFALQRQTSVLHFFLDDPSALATLLRGR